MYYNTLYLQQILSFDKGDIFFYIITGTILFYIWFESQISINYLIPFIILLMIIFYRQDYLHNENIIIDHKLKDINEHILYFLEDIKIYNKYNSNNFNDLLDILNKFYKNKTINELYLVLEIFSRFIYTIPLEMSKDYYIKINKLNKILYNNIKPNKLNKVEMQSYIPYNFIKENYDYI